MMISKYQGIIATDDVFDLIEQITNLDLDFPCTILIGANCKASDDHMKNMYFDKQESLF